MRADALMSLPDYQKQAEVFLAELIVNGISDDAPWEVASLILDHLRPAAEAATGAQATASLGVDTNSETLDLAGSTGVSPDWLDAANLANVLDVVGPLVAAHDLDIVAELCDQHASGSLPRVEFACHLGSIIAANRY